MAEHDLSKTIIPYLNGHLAFPLLAHLSELSIFPIRRSSRSLSKYELANDMFDDAAQLFQTI
ncbi:hypothetical protein D9611_011715 [Ephemerocybe angulata]|uniref:Eukaryotic translation initiation factor 3 subunit E N-terminal domain-containing protein n=1 Tax=Ephemerocybe angulata TaxID=980116 RepID=A0A8H5C546_9AGAR|nr:hypothetical protein D9611_011715 [Tulosesus angulatus]